MVHNSSDSWDTNANHWVTAKYLCAANCVLTNVFSVISNYRRPMVIQLHSEESLPVYDPLVYCQRLRILPSEVSSLPRTLFFAANDTNRMHNLWWTRHFPGFRYSIFRFLKNSRLPAPQDHFAVIPFEVFHNLEMCILLFFKLSTVSLFPLADII